MNSLPLYHYTDKLTVSCNGNNGQSTHPQIYLNLEEKGEIVCPYCSCHFIFKQNQNNVF